MQPGLRYVVPMTDTTKNETAGSIKLVWRRKHVWGSMGLSYFADHGGWKLAVDRGPEPRSWRLRCWKDGAFALYDTAPTLRDAKVLAQDTVTRPEEENS